MTDEPEILKIIKKWKYRGDRIGEGIFLYPINKPGKRIPYSNDRAFKKEDKQYQCKIL